MSGLILGLLSIFPENFSESNIDLYVLYILMFLVGIGVSSDKRILIILKKINIKILLVPFSVVLGTFLGVLFLSIFPCILSFNEILAVSSGFGYYSLSSIIISEISGETLGVIALLSNICREIITLLLTPVFAKYFGKLAPIASGGATSMDTTLPVITKYIGKDYAIISVFSGMVLTILVPVIIPLVLVN